MLCALNSVSVAFVRVVILVFQLESLMINQGGVFLPGESRYVELRLRRSILYIHLQAALLRNMSVFEPNGSGFVGSAPKILKPG